MSDGEKAGQPLGESGMKSVHILDRAGGGVPTTNASAVEVVQRSGMFGKLLSIEREQVSGVHLSMKSDATFRSSVSRMSSTFYTKSDGGMEDMGTSPPQHASWPAIAAIMVSEVCGIGVLTLSQKYAELGWIPATLSILGMFGLLVFTSNLMVEVKKVFPAIVTMADAADYTFGRYVYFFTEGMLATLLVVSLGDFVLLVGKTLGSALFSVHLCSPLWTLIGAAALLPIIQLRTLSSTTVLCVINMISIMIAIALVIAGLVINGRGPEVKSPIVAENLTFLGFMQSLSAIFFAFGGQFMFYELMSEMKDFTDFPKTFSIMGPFQVSLYLVVGCVGYHFLGTEASGYFLDNLGFTISYRIASALLCFHVMVSYLILGNVLARMLHLKVSPKHVNDLGWRGKLEWFGCTSSILVVSVVVANAIPFFDLLTSLIGGLLVTPLCLILPMIFYVKTRFMVEQKIKWWEWIIYVVIICFGIMVLVVSTIENFRAIIANAATYGLPFACHCQDLWDTCDCSPVRMEFSGFNCTVSP